MGSGRALGRHSFLIDVPSNYIPELIVRGVASPTQIGYDGGVNRVVFLLLKMF